MTDASAARTRPEIFSRESFARVLQSPSVSAALFLPVERAEWVGPLYTLRRNTAAPPRSDFTGVRLLTPDPRNVDASREQSVQRDLRQLIESVVRLRAADPALAGTVLSKETLIGRDASGLTRVRFGLACDPAGSFREENAAAAECHRQIVRACRRGWFTIEPEPRFDGKQGFRGLTAWADGVRLRKTGDWRWLLLLLLLLPFLLPTCGTADPIAGRTRSFIIVLDRSGSMSEHFPVVQQEARRTLDAITQPALERALGMLGRTWYVNLISYDSQPSSLFGELRPVTTESAGQVLAGIDALAAGGGTDLESAINLAAREIRAHGRETTLCIITDGKDDSIQRLIADMRREPAAVRDRFGMKAGESPIFHANTLTPRLLESRDPNLSTTPQTSVEEQLSEFSSLYFGAFGFTGITFSQRGMVVLPRAWNTLLRVGQMAAIIGFLYALYPIVRSWI